MSLAFLQEVRDVLIWKASRNGNFSVKSLYHVLQGTTNLIFPWKGVWTLPLLWKCLSLGLQLRVPFLTLNNSRRRGWSAVIVTTFARLMKQQLITLCCCEPALGSYFFFLYYLGDAEKVDWFIAAWNECGVCFCPFGEKEIEFLRMRGGCFCRFHLICLVCCFCGLENIICTVL